MKGRNDTAEIRNRVASILSSKLGPVGAILKIAHEDAPSLCDDVDSLRVVAVAAENLIAAHETRYVAIRGVHELDAIPVTQRDPGAWCRAYEVLGHPESKLAEAQAAHKVVLNG